MLSTAKVSRKRVQVSSKETARIWRKRLGKPTHEIEAAIAKVGDNPETVMKELAARRR